MSARRFKHGKYDVETNDKLKEKGYNLFREVVDEGHSTKASKINGIPRSLLMVDDHVVKKGKKSKFFRDFLT